MKKVFLGFLAVLILSVNAYCLNIVSLGAQYFPQVSAGRPISSGYIYVGEPDTDPEVALNQKQISVKEEDGTVTQVLQPLRTSSGGVPIYNGSPVTILVDGDYSLKVLDSSEVQILYVPSSSMQFSPTTYYIGNYDGLADAVSSIGSDEVTLLINEETAIAEGTTVIIPATMTLMFTDAGAITETVGGSAETLTVNGAIISDPLKEIFTNVTVNGTARIKFVYPAWFGAAGNGTENDTTDLADSETFAESSGVPIYVPASEIYTTTALTTDVSIFGEGTIKAFTGAAGAVIIPDATDIEIDGITIDGATLIEGIETSTGNVADRIKITNVKINNAAGGGMVIKEADDFIVSGCTVRGITGVFGDGIYTDTSSRGLITGNVVRDVTRIGIVAEANSDEIIISGNDVSYAHDASGGATNGGIWAEGASNITITDNLINNTGTYGILASSAAVDNVIIVTNNRVDTMTTGISLGGTNAGTSHICIGNSIQNFTTGVQVLAGRDIDISNNKFGDVAYATDGAASILVNNTSSGNILTLTIKDNKIGANTYTDADSADLHILAATNAIGDIYLSGMRGWRISERTGANIATNLFLSDSAVTFSSTSHIFIKASSIFIDNTSFTLASNMTLGVDSASVRISNSNFSGNYIITLSEADDTPTYSVSDSFFTNTRMDQAFTSGTINLKNDTFNQYTTYALQTGPAAGTYYLWVRGCLFTNTVAGSTPIQKNSVWATTSSFSDNAHNTTLLYTDVPTQESDTLSF